MDERKNQHKLEVTRSLLIHMNVPKYLWSEAVLTSVYLINRMPSKLKDKHLLKLWIQNQIPFIYHRRFFGVFTMFVSRDATMINWILDLSSVCLQAIHLLKRGTNGSTQLLSVDVSMDVLLENGPFTLVETSHDNSTKTVEKLYPSKPSKFVMNPISQEAQMPSEQETSKSTEIKVYTRGERGVVCSITSQNQIQENFLVQEFVSAISDQENDTNILFNDLHLPIALQKENKVIANIQSINLPHILIYPNP